MSSPKLNSMRVLERFNVPYEVLSYPATTRDAEEVAELLGLPAFMVYKTLVVLPEAAPKPVLVLLPADQQLDIKRLAQGIGAKKAKMATHAEAERLTGLQVGGISPLMLLDKGWKVYLDSTATQQQNVVISAGQRGLQLRVPVVPLLNILRASVLDLGAG